jgi:hypothetical protein
MEYLLMFGWAALGAVLHWTKKFRRGQTSASLFEYIKHNPKSSFFALIGLIIPVATVMATGLDVYSNQTIASLILAGYTADSALNETPEQAE